MRAKFHVALRPDYQKDIMRFGKKSRIACRNRMKVIGLCMHYEYIGISSIYYSNPVFHP